MTILGIFISWESGLWYWAAGLVIVAIISLVQWLTPLTDDGFDRMMQQIEEEECEL